MEEETRMYRNTCLHDVVMSRPMTGEAEVAAPHPAKTPRHRGSSPCTGWQWQWHRAVQGMHLSALTLYTGLIGAFTPKRARKVALGTDSNTPHPDDFRPTAHTHPADLGTTTS